MVGEAVAIDGAAASGKSAVGRTLARRLGCRFLDTGAMYRAVTWVALDRGVDPRDEDALGELCESTKLELVPADDTERLLADGEDVTGHLRDPGVERTVSLVSRVSLVRATLVRRQRAIADEAPIVMAGRDIGTVVLPEATAKFYLTASVAVRSGRRYRELQARGESTDLDEVIDDLKRRDKIDTERVDSPLRPAEDAMLIETDDLGVEELVQRLEGTVRDRLWTSSSG